MSEKSYYSAACDELGHILVKMPGMEYGISDRDEALRLIQSTLNAMKTTWPDLKQEIITWHDASTNNPDTDLTVMCWSETTGFFSGYWDDEIKGWIGCESGGSVLGVTYWADPSGPHAPHD